MSAQILLLGLAFTCSALRIQQKEKDASGCFAGVATCEGFLDGHQCSNIGTCSAQEQATAALEVTKMASNCFAGFSCSWFTAGDCSNQASVNKYYDLVSCLTTAPTGRLISTRALLDPSGLIPSKYVDPVMSAAITAQNNLLDLAKKADYPGSPPFGACIPPLARGGEVVTLCNSNTNMFDGVGVCCSNKHVTTDLPVGRRPVTYTGSVASATACAGVTGFAANPDAANKGTGMVHYKGGGGAFCVYNVRYHNCVRDTCTTSGSGTSCTNGGTGTEILKHVKICS